MRLDGSGGGGGGGGSLVDSQNLVNSLKWNSLVKMFSSVCVEEPDSGQEFNEFMILRVSKFPLFFFSFITCNINLILLPVG